MSELGPLNLAGADLKGFDAVDPGRYQAEIFEIKVDAVKNETGEGKLPAGTPMLKIQYRLVSDIQGNTEGIENRRVFQQLVIPPKGYDEKKASVMKGMVARFFMALGYTEDEVTGAKFDPDLSEQVGKEVTINVSREPKKDRSGEVIEGEFNNNVKSVKPRQEAGVATGLL